MTLRINSDRSKLSTIELRMLIELCELRAKKSAELYTRAFNKMRELGRGCTLDHIQRAKRLNKAERCYEYMAVCLREELSRRGYLEAFRASVDAIREMHRALVGERRSA